MWRNYKYIFDFYTGEGLLFDLGKDPAEKHDLSERMPGLRDRLKRVLFDHKSAVERRFAGLLEKRKIDEQASREGR